MNSASSTTTGLLTLMYFVVLAEGQDVSSPTAEYHHVSEGGPNKEHSKHMKCNRRYAAMAAKAMFSECSEVLDKTPILLALS
jgi:hypothetical protein